MKKELLPLQYLRALAVMLVVWVHAKEQFVWVKEAWPSEFGIAGVDIFFVVSGFIMVYTTYNRSVTPAQFFWRRIKRIVPLYWFFTLLLFAVALILPSVVKSVEVDVGHLLASLFFVPMLSPAFPESYFPLLIPGWTLNYEMAFYLVFAAVLWAPERYRVGLLAVLMVGYVVIAQFYAQGVWKDFYAQTLILDFLLGVLIARAYVKGWYFSSNRAGWMLIAASVLYFIVFFSSGVVNDRFLGIGIPAALMVMGALAFNPKEGWVHHVWHELGNASYSIYLSHVVTLGVIRYVWGALFGGSDYGMVVGVMFILLAIVVSSLVGWVVYHLIEVRINRYLRHKSH